MTGTIYVVARTLADPPRLLPPLLRRTARGRAGRRFRSTSRRTRSSRRSTGAASACSGWMSRYRTSRSRRCPRRSNLPPPPSQTVDRYVTLGVNFSIFRNGSWAPAQAAKGKLFDKPFYDPTRLSDIEAVEALYTLKVQTPAPVPRLWREPVRRRVPAGGLQRMELRLAESTLDVQSDHRRKFDRSPPIWAAQSLTAGSATWSCATSRCPRERSSTCAGNHRLLPAGYRRGRASADSRASDLRARCSAPAAAARQPGRSRSRRRLGTGAAGGRARDVARRSGARLQLRSLRSTSPPPAPWSRMWARS